MSNLPYATELFSGALAALFTLLISYIAFQRQLIMERRKLIHDAASVTIIEYIDEIIRSLSDLRYSTSENEDDARIRLINTLKYQQVISSRLQLLKNKKLIDDFDKFMKSSSLYSQTTGQNHSNMLNLDAVTYDASVVLEHLLKKI